MFGLFVDYNTKRFCYAHHNLAFDKFTVKKCQYCGRNIAVIPVGSVDEYLIEGGKQYPDFLYYGGGGFCFLVSERVMNVFEGHKVTGYGKAVAVNVHRNNTCGIEQQYYSLNITGKIDFDLKAMALKKKNICPTCNQFEWSRQRLSIIKTVFDMDSWDKSDLCRITSSPGHIVCSEKVKNIILEHQFSGVILQDEDSIFRIP